MNNKLVIIPTYNEKENIGPMIDTVMELPVGTDLLIIDDNSPDGTAGIVKQAQTKYNGKLHLIERAGKLGLGTAYIEGFNWALKNGYQFICEMDADFSHNPLDLKLLFEACETEGNDLSIGSRYISGVNVVNWPMSRVLISYFASMYVRFITRMKVRDATAGFVCYRRSVLETINLNKIRFKGYAFQIEMKFTAWKFGFRIKEVPIIFTDRKAGSSKMSGKIVNEAVWGVIRLTVSSWFRKYRKVGSEE
ncbi:MAG: polyprenol monophosphomannose synthase [Bacteroidota bacterium]